MPIEITTELIKKLSQWWEETELTLAIPYIDSQHLWLCALMFQGENALKLTNQELFQKTFSQILRYLYLYAERHFKAEEAILQHFSYPAREEHRRRHASFVQYLERFQKYDFTPQSAETLLHFLKAWLVTHVKKEDFHYAAFFARRQADVLAFLEEFASHTENHLLAEEKMLFEKILAKKMLIYNRESVVTDTTREIYRNLRLETGIPIVDIQHLWLVKLMVKLEIMLKQKKEQTPGETIEILKEIVRYTRDHFMAEENLMRIMDYGPRDIHHQKHASFMKSMQTKYKNHLISDKQLAQNLLHDLRDWLYHHIATEDKLLGAYSRSRPTIAIMACKKLLSEGRISLRAEQISFYKAIRQKTS
ncbi:MAG: hemerythrin family protein [Leptospiraceae bacterium]|nr:hemerythrin family protein [Leptospiraceae bacterium]MDW8306727.1 hemerythrin family protein [Leptospiraceae bacterium]